MKHIASLLIPSLILGAVFFSATEPGAQSKVPVMELLAKWRTAVHALTKSGRSGTEVVTTLNQEGIRTELREWVTGSGNYHGITKREFDTSEVVLTDQVAKRRDWNGFVRSLEGSELDRQRTDIRETRTVLLGPPPAMTDASVLVDSAQSSVLLQEVVALGDTLTWHIDPKTGLPVKSVKSSDDTQITTTYENWREVDGLLTPFKGSVTEPNRPDYTWERQSVKRRDSIRAAEFAAPAPLPLDTRLEMPPQWIEFNFENDHILFEVSLNGRKPKWFLLDTGADEENINEKYVAEYGLEPYGKTTTEGGGGSAEYSYARGATFTLPGVEIRNQHVAILDETGLERAYGMAIGGILGYDFISRFVIEIDYEKHLIAFHDPVGWKYEGNGIILPITIEDGIPYADATISVPTKDSIPAHMLLDFGAAETMTLTSPFVKKNDLLKLAATNASVNGMAGLENQFFTQTNVRGRISRLALGKLVVDSFPVNLSVNTKGAYASSAFSGTVGEGIYHRFHTFLDYTRNRIIFEPTAESFKPYPERMSYGLTLVASGDDLHTYTVAGIRADSPADKDGFKKGDIVTGLDQKTSGQFTLGELRQSFAHDGEHHQFTVHRDSSEVPISVDVRRISIDRK